MNIVVCGSCGFLGSEKELVNLPLSPQGVNVKVFDFIQLNNLHCRCCPSCKSTLLFYKSSPDIISISNLPPGGINIPAYSIPQQITTAKDQLPQFTILSQESVEDTIDPELLQEVFESAETPSVIQVEKSKENIKPNRTEDTKIRVKKKCDVCSKEFNVKPGEGGFGSQCPSCLKATMKKYVG